jgi:hypothetical protein
MGDTTATAAAPPSRFGRICVFCGSNPGNRPVYGDAALDLGKELVKFDLSLPRAIPRGRADCVATLCPRSFAAFVSLSRTLMAGFHGVLFVPSEKFAGSEGDRFGLRRWQRRVDGPDRADGS